MMQILLTIISTCAIIACGSLALTMNFGLQEDLPIMGYIGFVIQMLLTLIPVACVGLQVAFYMERN